MTTDEAIKRVEEARRDHRGDWALRYARLETAVRDLIVALSTPPADDVREARSWIEKLLSGEGFGADYSDKELDEWAADLLVQVRPRGTVTDAKVDAAYRAHEDAMRSGENSFEAMRAALETARGVRS